MFKQRMIKFMAHLVLLAVLTGSAGLGADSSGLAVTLQATGCSSGGSSGGGC